MDRVLIFLFVLTALMPCILAFVLMGIVEMLKTLAG